MTIATRLTLDEFLRQPDEKPYREYVCGEAIAKPMPNQNHAFLQGFLFMVLYQFLARTKLGRVGTEWRCVLGPPGAERAYVPDVTLVARRRLRGDGLFQGAPDLAIEILSPDQPAGRFADKIAFYLRHGVRLVWVVDPAERTVLVLAPDAESRVLHEGETLDGGDVLPGFTLPLADLFAELRVEP